MGRHVSLLKHGELEKNCKMYCLLVELANSSAWGFETLHITIIKCLENNRCDHLCVFPFDIYSKGQKYVNVDDYIWH